MKKIILINFFLHTFLYAKFGSIIGEVIDVNTHQPLIGANVIVENTKLGSACDKNGKFDIKNIPIGSYTISASVIGYSKVSKANVTVYFNRETPIKFHLKETSIKGQEILVQSGYFEQAKDGIVSTQTIDREEIRSDPIGVYDIQMMVHSLPSVITATDQNNEIIVRGGGPGENLFIVDNLEIPNPNHFGEVGTGGGPINILNTEFVERINFFAGAFPSKYGDKQSSVMEIHLREGNYRNVELDLEMSMAGIGFLVEGPIFDNKGSYISSYRRSFLKHLIKSAGLIAVPEYWNSQHKFTYNIDNRKKLMINFISGNDSISIKNENRPDLRGAENVNYQGNQYTLGLTFKSLFSLKGYYLFSIGKTFTKWNANVYKNEYEVIDTFFRRNNIEYDDFIKYDIIYKFKANWELSAGINTKYGYYSINELLDPDTVYAYDYPELSLIQLNQLKNYSNYYEAIEANPSYDSLLNNFIVLPNPVTINNGLEHNNSGRIWKHSLYNQIKYNFKQFLITVGFRYDYVPFNNTSQFSPRIGLSYSISPINKINLAMGQYFQSPNYWILMNPNNEFLLQHSFTNQIVMGYEHYFDDDIKLTLELYNKNFYNRPIKKSDITLNSLDNYLGFVDIGEGYSNGFELFIQKKFAAKWYTTLSYSNSNSKTKDYRENHTGYFPSNYDIRNSLTFVGGYKFNFLESKWYQNIKYNRFFSFVFWLPFMPSDQLEISLRYRYSDGLPFTPKKFDFIFRRWFIDNNYDINSHTYGSYNRFDLMVLRRFNFKKINLITYLDLQNIFNHNNEWERVYLDDGTYQMSYQYKQIPVGGIIIEF